MKTNITFYYDYLCPFASRLASWLLSLKKPDTPDMPDFDITWKTFSLEQNSSKKEGFKYWEHPDQPSIGVRALAASKAVKTQGETVFLAFHKALFTARHEERKNIGKLPVLSDIAEKSGADARKMAADLNEKACWAAVGTDHEEGVARHNLFGVPSLVFSKGRPVYIKLTAIPSSATEQVSLFHMIREMAEDRPYLEEFKRPDMVMF